MPSRGEGTRSTSKGEDRGPSPWNAWRPTSHAGSDPSPEKVKVRWGASHQKGTMGSDQRGGRLSPPVCLSVSGSLSCAQ